MANILAGVYAGGAGRAFIGDALSNEFFTPGSVNQVTTKTIASVAGIVTITCFNLTSMINFGEQVSSLCSDDRRISKKVFLITGIIGALGGIQQVVLGKKAIAGVQGKWPAPWGPDMVLLVNIICGIYTAAGGIYSLDPLRLQDGKLYKRYKKEIRITMGDGCCVKFISFLKILTVILGFTGTMYGLGVGTYKGFASADNTLEKIMGGLGVVGLICPTVLVGNGIANLLPTTEVILPADQSGALALPDRCTRYIATTLGKILSVSASIAQSGMVAEVSRSLFCEKDESFIECRHSLSLWGVAFIKLLFLLHGT